MMPFQVAYNEYCKRYQRSFNPRTMPPRDSWWRDYLYNLVPRMPEPSAPQPSPETRPRTTSNEQKMDSSSQTLTVTKDRTTTEGDKSERVTGILNGTYKSVDLDKPQA